jgi:WD40 repeat protein
VSASADSTLKIWKVIVTESANGVTGTPKFLVTMNGHTDAVYSVSISKNLYIVSASADRSIIVWSLQTGKVVSRFMGHMDGVRTICCLPSGLTVSGSFDHTLRIWRYTPPASADPAAH